MCIEEVSIPTEVLKQAEASEMRARADYVNSGEYLKEIQL